MSLYIPGIEIPKEGYVTIQICDDGNIWVKGRGDLKEKAVPVPPHGRLIDADALIAAHEQVCSRSMKFNLDLAPTIIPAEEGET